MDHVGAPANEESSQQRRPEVMVRLKLSVSVSNRSAVVLSVNGASVVFQAIIMLLPISITVSTQTGLFTHARAESIPEAPPFTGKSLMGLCLLSEDVDMPSCPGAWHIQTSEYFLYLSPPFLLIEACFSVHQWSGPVLAAVAFNVNRYGSMQLERSLTKGGI